MKIFVLVIIGIDINSANLKDIINGFREALNPCFQNSENDWPYGFACHLSGGKENSFYVYCS
ncbi:MAG: hypothetical protein JRJ77_16125 [Deltaproteobacteria bacterium]|nr:hypothetical protein [Deltaproteobacteria bacterium]